MKTTRYNLMFALALCLPLTLSAQLNKLDKTYKTSNDVEVKIDASHTNIEVGYWDRDEVQIQAILEVDDTTKEKTKELLASWDLNTSGNNSVITISSGGGMLWNGDIDLSGLEKPLSSLPQMLEPLLNNLVTPLMESMGESFGAPLPPEFSEKMGEIKFDYEAYQKDGDKYLAKFEKEMEANLGGDFEKSMEKWASQFEKNAEKWEKNFEMKMNINEKELEKSMEEWAESFGKDMEAWGEAFGAQMEARFGESAKGEPKVIALHDSKAKKTLKLHIPKNARLKLDVRHGGVKLLGTSNNLRAKLSHSRLNANRIGGKSTRVEAAYTPVNINYWSYGIMDAKYVKNFNIKKVKSIKLTSNSSNVNIDELEDTGILSGNFGELNILRLDTNFKNLDINLENSDLELGLPGSAFNFIYSGTQSDIKHPNALNLTSSESYDNKKLSGYHKAKDSGGNISIKANFSEVLLN
ncbi:hypothetical protein [Salegentibacter maritimus]|uniref:Adhesin domain-containing protein n=1 Tax=Salegentibacter maritimus TaxID=2794347 RepID=A0ABS0TG47_9FLAO|nr:hypothetical protein [Salegentibacter maritimus]MBI6120029.1 hypothetical protein [Salegentibacter maritimus]